MVGGGIVGLATAYRLSQKLPAAEITVIEKETSVGRHQTGHNSGVLHAGLYYKPGSAKARMAVRGIRQMVEFCQEHGIAYYETSFLESYRELLSFLNEIGAPLRAERIRV